MVFRTRQINSILSLLQATFAAFSCNEASYLSAPYFHPSRMSLVSPHMLLTSAGSNPYEVAKARVQLQFLCSTYRSAKLCRHWTPSNPNGFCTFSTCWSDSEVETSEHILLFCPAYQTTRLWLFTLGSKLRNFLSQELVAKFFHLSTPRNIVQLLLDCTALPEVIALSQLHGQDIYDDLFYYGRTWCFSIHRERQKRLCRWNFE